jgi:hypothetical protein
MQLEKEPAEVRAAAAEMVVSTTILRSDNSERRNDLRTAAWNALGYSRRHLRIVAVRFRERANKKQVDIGIRLDAVLVADPGRSIPVKCLVLER